MQMGETAFVDQGQRVVEHVIGFGGEPGDKVCAERRVGPQPADFRADRHRIGAVVAALHALEDHIVTGLDAEMKKRQQPGLVADQPHELVIHLHRVERRHP